MRRVPRLLHVDDGGRRAGDGSAGKGGRERQQQPTAVAAVLANEAIKALPKNILVNYY